MKTHDHYQRGPCDLWVPRSEFLEQLERDHPPMSVEEQRARGYLKKEGTGVRRSRKSIGGTKS